MVIHIQETDRIPNRPNQKRISPCHLLGKTLSTQKKRKLEAAGEKHRLIVEANPPAKQQISQQNLHVRSAWSDVFQALNDNICQSGFDNAGYLEIDIEIAHL